MSAKVQKYNRKLFHIYWINIFTFKRKRRGSCGAMSGVCIYFNYCLWTNIKLNEKNNNNFPKKIKFYN